MVICNGVMKVTPSILQARGLQAHEQRGSLPNTAHGTIGSQRPIKGSRFTVPPPQRVDSNEVTFSHH